MIKGKRVLVILYNILYVFDIGINLLSINKLLDIDIVIAFYKAKYILIKNNLILIDTRNRDLFFLDL